MATSDRTHLDDKRIIIGNFGNAFYIMVVFPFILYFLTRDMWLTLAAALVAISATMDLTLTIYALRIGYKEQNYYKLFINRLGEKNGIRLTVIVNLAIRAAVIFVFRSMPIGLMTFAVGSFFGPLWNGLHLTSFYDDTVMQFPTEVHVDKQQTTIDSGYKTRLEAKKEGDKEE